MSAPDKASAETSSRQQIGLHDEGASRSEAEIARTFFATHMKLHGTMLLLGLGLAVVALQLRSVNSLVRRALDDTGSPADRARTMLQTRLAQGGQMTVAAAVVLLSYAWVQLKLARVSPTATKWRRRYGVVPAPAHLEAFHRASLRGLSVLYAGALALALVPAGLLLLVGPTMYGPPPPSAPVPNSALLATIGRWTNLGVVLACIPIAVWAITDAWPHRRALSRIRRWLDQGIPACLKCGHPLRGLRSPRCPECGEPWTSAYPSADGEPVLPGEAAPTPGL